MSALSEVLSGQSRIGLDTEFMRESTYFPQLCLVQIATGQKIYCADPLGGGDLEALWQALRQPSWVVHSGRQDIEVLFLGGGLMPRRIFDTQVAASLLGHMPQLGYAALVSELFGVELAKSHTRANWSRRPLAEEYLSYAAEDVEYLLPAFELLVERLSMEGRLGWAEEDSDDLLDQTLYVADPAAAIERVKGARYLSGRARRAAQMLAAWREQEALRLDRPRQWIFKDSVLLDLAVAGPQGTAALARTSELPPKMVRRAGDDLLAILAEARSDAADSPDSYAAPARLDDTEKKRLKPMQALIAAVAKDLGVMPEIIASRRELTEALHGARNLRVLRGWRRELVGEKLLEVLAK
ncbi:MAG: ribonuclease D [Woeseia sp.]